MTHRKKAPTVAKVLQFINETLDDIGTVSICRYKAVDYNVWSFRYNIPYRFYIASRIDGSNEYYYLGHDKHEAASLYVRIIKGKALPSWITLDVADRQEER